MLNDDKSSKSLLTSRMAWSNAADIFTSFFCFVGKVTWSRVISALVTTLLELLEFKLQTSIRGSVLLTLSFDSSSMCWDGENLADVGVSWLGLCLPLGSDVLLLKPSAGPFETFASSIAVTSFLTEVGTSENERRLLKSPHSFIWPCWALTGRAQELGRDGLLWCPFTNVEVVFEEVEDEPGVNSFFEMATQSPAASEQWSRDTRVTSFKDPDTFVFF